MEMKSKAQQQQSQLVWQLHIPMFMIREYIPTKLIDTAA